jgi:nucleoside-diphosphate-sugar epimerase
MTEAPSRSGLRILVTGATGLVGRHICDALVRAGHDVHGVARGEGDDAGFIRHAVDLLDPIARSALLGAVQPDIIVHSAWITTHGIYWHSPANLDWMSATLGLVREGAARGMKRFVGVGTCAEYKWGISDRLREGETPLEPATLYGAAKDATRRIVEAFAAEAGFTMAWARIGMIYGPEEHPDRFVASLAKALAEGKPARMSSGRVIRDYLHARDAGAAIAAVATSPLAGAVNIGSGVPVRLLEIGQQLAAMAGRPDLLQAGAYPDRPGEPDSLVLDVGRLSNEAGFKPAISLEAGLAGMLEHWRRVGS